MRDMLARVTGNRFLGILTGAAVTATIQSSSITTVLLVGFVSAGLMSTYAPFLDFMLTLDNPLLAALAGAGFTALVQSSSATTGILIVMAGQGLIGLESAIALALGANIGTCVTAILASIGKPREAVRSAVIHTLFNVVGVLIWIGLVGQLADLARLISPSYPSLVGFDRTAAEIPRQIANIHTFFNVANAALFIGFTFQITRLVEWLVPDRPLMKKERYAPRFLNDKLLETPSIALDATRREAVLLGRLVVEMLRAVIPAATSGSRLDLDRLYSMDRPIDILHQGIVLYLRNLSLDNLSSKQSDQLMALMKIANDMEHIGDRIATGIVTSAKKRIDEGVVISKPTVNMLTDLQNLVLEALIEAVDALDGEDLGRARAVLGMKQNLDQRIEAIMAHEVQRLQTDEPNRLMTYAREIELVEILDYVFKTSSRIAQTQLSLHKMPKTSD